MDETDLLLSLKLLVNSRTSLNDLANAFGMSINAIHKRIRILADLGVIREFTARLNLMTLGATVVLFVGRSELRADDALFDEIAQTQLIYWLGMGAEKMVYIGAYLRDISDLESLTRFARDRLGVDDPRVLIHAPSPPRLRKDPLLSLKSLDYRIIYALHHDSRKTISVLADELGISAKTVRKHLNTLVEKQFVELSLKWFPDASNDIISLAECNIKKTIDFEKSLRTLRKKYSPNWMFEHQFVNQPALCLAWLWTPTMKEFQGVYDSLRAESIFDSIDIEILHHGFLFDTWRDSLLKERAMKQH
jgi:DNA-binding Lrp family transcriptional regulator